MHLYDKEDGSCLHVGGSASNPVASVDKPLLGHDAPAPHAPPVQELSIYMLGAQRQGACKQLSQYLWVLCLHA